LILVETAHVQHNIVTHTCKRMTTTKAILSNNRKYSSNKACNFRTCLVKTQCRQGWNYRWAINIRWRYSLLSHIDLSLYFSLSISNPEFRLCYGYGALIETCFFMFVFIHQFKTNS